MHVLAQLSEILFPFPLPVWVSQRDQLCLPFTCLEYVSMCTCRSVRLCVHTHVCVQAVGWVKRGREQLFHTEQLHIAHLTASHPRKQPGPGTRQGQSQRPALKATCVDSPCSLHIIMRHAGWHSEHLRSLP